MASLETRKPVTRLTCEDFESFRIWEYCLDEELEIDGQKMDETWVRPLSKKRIPKNAYSKLTASDFLTSEGIALKGFMIVSTGDGSVEVTPGAIIHANKYLVLPTVSRAVAESKGYDWSLKDRVALSSSLGKAEKFVFPISFRLSVHVTGELLLREGQID